MNEVTLSLSCSPAPRACHIYIEVMVGFLPITYRNTSLFEKEYLLIYRTCVLTWHRKKMTRRQILRYAKRVLLSLIVSFTRTICLFFHCKDKDLS